MTGSRKQGAACRERRKKEEVKDKHVGADPCVCPDRAIGDRREGNGYRGVKVFQNGIL